MLYGFYVFCMALYYHKKYHLYCLIIVHISTTIKGKTNVNLVFIFMVADILSMTIISQRCQ